MGLDMYLEYRIYISPYADSTKELRTIIAGIISAPEGTDVTGINVLVGTWCKANAVHAWFVDNVQGGEDNCKDYYVEDEQLTELADACRQVLAARDTPEAEQVARDLLPTREGFFFGGQDIGDYYYQNIKGTLEIIERAHKCTGGGIYYSSSW